MEKLDFNGVEYAGYLVPTPHGVLLAIRGHQGMLGCGYFNMQAAEKFGDALAIVTGVKTFHDMINAEVVQVSSAAAALGVQAGMSGLSALEKMK